MIEVEVTTGDGGTATYRGGKIPGMESIRIASTLAGVVAAMTVGADSNPMILMDVLSGDKLEKLIVGVLKHYTRSVADDRGVKLDSEAARNAAFAANPFEAMEATFELLKAQGLFRQAFGLVTRVLPPKAAGALTLQLSNLMSGASSEASPPIAPTG